METITEYRHNPSKNAYGEMECDHGNSIPGYCWACQYLADAVDDEFDDDGDDETDEEPYEPDSVHFVPGFGSISL